jgi:hypothetical protein
MKQVLIEVLESLDGSENPFTVDLDSVCLETLPEFEALDCLPDVQESEAA